MVIQEYLDFGHMCQVPSERMQIIFIFRIMLSASLTAPLRRPVWCSTRQVHPQMFRHNQKVYRQIIVDSRHTPFQRILFRNSTGDICDYKLITVTFGRGLLATIYANQSNHRLASQIIRDYMYVYDVLAGAHTMEAKVQAIRFQMALDAAGFPLRKWTSNKKKLLVHIPKDGGVLRQTNFSSLPAMWRPSPHT
ncbi:uncharacterized protein LOC115633656 [Scaptodrosophila lebanonensis]|uniref:Uncharacterized protein LOC115633656 n=1 Tax=Drosophila lebanonensis TaxID=7225 RepID=A0A6J2UER2_DROLE|nr:uncharacterized protein LOC115633656 [Scaptodrosophila lebanonensis]